jgi:hypothetical protein
MSKISRQLNPAELLRQRARVLGNELARANTHLHYFQGLLSNYRVLNKAKDFWDYTLAGHCGMAIRNLGIIYDTHRDGLNLVNLLDVIDVKMLDAAGVKKLQTFRAVVNKTSADPAVRSLRQWRNNIVAHLNGAIADANREQFSKQNPLDEAMLQALIDKGFEIVEWCAQIGGDPKEFQRFPEGKDGHAQVLEALNSMSQLPTP